ncbi:hypothetical protein KFE98_14775 [bacterium SCSIO 12741]|nr:hypothetical protein KFE98_14775 [bacterium SCSIO 12741]
MKVLPLLLIAFVLLSCQTGINQESKEFKDIEPILEKPEEGPKPKSDQSQKVELKTEKSYDFGDLQATVSQIKSDGTEFYCRSKLVTSRSNNRLDSVEFESEPVGGYYGISKPKALKDHLIFTQHGDYFGFTLIVNKDGEINDIPGGFPFFDSESNLLFSIIDSDLGGFTVYDLKSDSLILRIEEMKDYPMHVHRAFGERYFLFCSTDDNKVSIWEIELELDRIMHVDLDSNMINKSTMLQHWSDESIHCECEK